MFFGEVSFGNGSAFAFLIAVDTLFEPVGDEGAFAGGGFIVGVHLGGIVTEHEEECGVKMGVNFIYKLQNVSYILWWRLIDCL